jgi:general stress protein YciG
MSEKSLRGFAAMDKEKQRAIASKGGKAAHARGTAHEFTPEEARAAGRKGGQAAHAKGTAHEFTPEEAREAGRKGGQSTQKAGPSTQSPRPSFMPNGSQPNPTAPQQPQHQLQPSSPMGSEIRTGPG